MRRAPIYSVFLCLIISTNTVAQKFVNKDTSSRTSTNRKVLIVIDTMTAFGIEEFIFNPAKIASVSIVQPDSAIQLYGQRAKYGAIIFKPTEVIKFIRLEAILNKFGIKKEDRNYRMCINGSVVDEPSNILADVDEVATVEITTKINRRYYDHSSGTEKFINIITREGQKNGLEQQLSKSSGFI